MGWAMAEAIEREARKAEERELERAAMRDDLRAAIARAEAAEAEVERLRASYGAACGRANEAEAALSKVGEHLGCDRDGRFVKQHALGILHVIDTEWTHETSSAPRLRSTEQEASR